MDLQRAKELLSGLADGVDPADRRGSAGGSCVQQG